MNTIFASVTGDKPYRLPYSAEVPFKAIKVADELFFALKDGKAVVTKGAEVLSEGKNALPDVWETELSLTPAVRVPFTFTADSVTIGGKAVPAATCSVSPALHLVRAEGFTLLLDTAHFTAFAACDDECDITGCIITPKEANRPL